VDIDGWLLSPDDNGGPEVLQADEAEASLWIA
jgi:hypothetical protein